MLAFDQHYLILDCETDGLNLCYSRPWEVALLFCKGNNIIESKQLFIDVPNLNLSQEIRMLTGFDEREYNLNKKPPKEVWDICKKYIYDPKYILVGQNILKYDSWLLKSLAKLAGEEDFDFSFTKRILDTRFLGLAHKNGIEKPRDGDYEKWFYKLHNDKNIKGNVGQLTLLKEFGIEFNKESLHSAEYDCRMCFEIFKHLKQALKL